MPNGRKGDHPLHDIRHHGLAVFGEPLDSWIRARTDEEVTSELGDLLLWADTHVSAGERSHRIAVAIERYKKVYDKPWTREAHP